jgi:hypothetical protein
MDDGEKPENEAYMTPWWVIRRLLEVWRPPLGIAVEPAVGEYAIVKSLSEFSPRISKWITCDIREVYPLAWAGSAPRVPIQHTKCDYTKTSLPVSDVSLVITNPPFSLAESFIRKARFDCPKAELVFLLRLGFLASADRSDLWNEIGEPNLWVLPNRPSYTTSKPGTLKTDKYDYGWFIWPPFSHTTSAPGEGFKRCGSLGHLKLTSLEERKLG